jgi:hypothetical protein
LLTLNPTGIFRERVETEVLIAPRRTDVDIRTAFHLPQPIG